MSHFHGHLTQIAHTNVTSQETADFPMVTPPVLSFLKRVVPSTKTRRHHPHLRSPPRAPRRAASASASASRLRRWRRCTASTRSCGSWTPSSPMPRRAARTGRERASERRGRGEPAGVGWDGARSVFWWFGVFDGCWTNICIYIYIYAGHPQDAPYIYIYIYYMHISIAILYISIFSVVVKEPNL